jgi:tyrosinase
MVNGCLSQRRVKVRISHTRYPLRLRSQLDCLGLAPFWKNEKEYWNSNDIRDHTVFNHTYPEYQDVPPGTDLRSHIRKKVDDLYGGPNTELLRVLNSQSSMDSWSVRIEILPFEIDRSFAMLVFLGEPADPTQWLSSRNLVGSYNVFISYRPEECENCTKYEGDTIEGFVHLTSSLLQLQLFQSPAQVIQYLKDTLYLGLQKVCSNALKRIDQH